MRYLPLATLFFLLTVFSCAENLEDQEPLTLVIQRDFEVDLEERRYGFGYVGTMFTQPNQPGGNTTVESILLTTENVSGRGEELVGVSQVIGVELKFAGSDIPDETRLRIDSFDPFAPRQQLLSVRVILGEDFDCATGQGRGESGIDRGQLTVIRYSGGAYSIMIDGMTTEDVPVRGTWTGKLQTATVIL